MSHHSIAIDISRENRRLDELGPAWAGRAWFAGFAGLVLAIAATVVVGLSKGDFSHALGQFMRSYVLAFAYAISIALGALFFVLIQHVTRAGWSVIVRRMAECVAGQLPWFALLSLPILISVWAGFSQVYPWSNAEVVASDPLLQHKAAYLNKTFFTLRFVLYFGIWWWLSSYMLNKSVEQDLTGDDQISVRIQRVASPGLLLYALTVTFFAFDLLMSLAPHFFSTMWGVQFFGGSMVAFYATAIIVLNRLQRKGRLSSALNQEHYHDLGKFLFAWVVFWAYVNFSPYMLIWYANLPEENFWYQARQHTSWWVFISLTLLFGHFVLPFLLTISRYPKRRPNLLYFAACWMLLMHFVDMHYLVAPDVHGFEEELKSGRKHPMAWGAEHLLTDVPMVLGLCGVFAYLSIREMSRNSLIPDRDPRLNESLAFENF